MHTQARSPAGGIAQRPGPFVSEKAGDKAGDALKGQEHPQGTKYWINEESNLRLPRKEGQSLGASGNGWPAVLSDVLEQAPHTTCNVGIR